MLTEAFPQLNTSRLVTELRAFLRSGWFAAVAVLFMACSELFGLEILVMYCYLAFGAAIVLFSEDMLPVVPLVCCGYMLFSAKNNPGKFPDSLFGTPAGQFALFFAVAVAAVLLVGRLVSMLIRVREKRGIPKFAAGYLMLGAAYLLSGAGSPYYDGRTVLMGFVQIAALSGFYFFFYYTIRWENVPKSYLPMVISIVGAGLLAEVGGMYFNEGVVTADGGIDRAMLYTGWGIYNNVGCMMAMCMPAPVYFAVKHKNGWRYTLLYTLYFCGVLLTQSRGAILFGSVVYLACVVVTLVCSGGRERLWHILVYAGSLLVAVGALLIFHKNFLDLFESLIVSGFNDSARFATWKACWERFTEYPVFGVGFYKTPGTMMTESGMYTEFVEGTPDGVSCSVSAVPPSKRRWRRCASRRCCSQASSTAICSIWDRGSCTPFCSSLPKNRTGRRRPFCKRKPNKRARRAVSRYRPPRFCLRRPAADGKSKSPGTCAPGDLLYDKGEK